MGISGGPKARVSRHIRFFVQASNQTEAQLD